MKKEQTLTRFNDRMYKTHNIQRNYQDNLVKVE